MDKKKKVSLGDAGSRKRGPQGHRKNPKRNCVVGSLTRGGYLRDCGEERMDFQFQENAQRGGKTKRGPTVKDKVAAGEKNEYK